MLDHADHLDLELDRPEPDVATVSMSLDDHDFLWSFNWSRWKLGSSSRSEE
jgi:hypothetical protein